MPSVTFFLFKSILTSAVLLMYYWFALRNRKFHSFNRFYLLATVLISLVIPFISFEWYTVYTAQAGNAFTILNAIDSGDIEKLPVNGSAPLITTGALMLAGYILVSAVLLFVLLRRINWIFKLKRMHYITPMSGYRLIHTQNNYSPFSFFNMLFWNEEIDINSATGQRIMRHEMAHIKQYHTLDKLWMQMVLVVLWINPFYWLIQKELSMVHEFIADGEAIEDNDTSSLAEMLLLANYGRIIPDIVHPFFYSPIKRRIIMLNEQNKTNYPYLRKLLVLPLLCSTILLFSFDRKNNTVIRSDKKIVMVIDAGHGGHENGAIANTGIAEKDMTLRIASKITRMGEDYNVEVVTTRKDDNFISLEARTEKANKIHADLFVSIHINSNDPGAVKSSPFEIKVDKRNPKFKESNILASAIIAQLNSSGKQSQLVQKGLMVLKQSEMPAVLIECGHIDNAKEMELINNEEALEGLCRNILSGVVSYQNRK